MTPNASPHRLRRVLGLLVVLAAAGTAVFLTGRNDDTTPAATASIFKVATVTEGNLDTAQQIEGSVVLSEVTSVLHRIEGQATSGGATATSSQPVGGNPSASGIVGAGGTEAVVTGAAITEAVGAVAPAADCEPAATATTVPGGGVPPPAATTPTTTPDNTAPDTTTTAPGPPGSDPGTSAPATTTPPATPPTTDCTPTAATTTTVVAGGDGTPPGGGTPTGGGTPPGGGTGGTATGGTATGTTARVTQLLTSVITAGSPVGLGTVLYSVESSPVVALAGSLPAWRTLSTESDNGTDILQLEMSLVALGYDPDATMTIDTSFDNDTEAVVEAWQAGYGIEVTGAVALGSVVFVGTQATVSSVQAASGDRVGDGDAVLALSTDSQQVVIDVPDGDEEHLVPGLIVGLDSGEGTITLLRSVERDGVVVVQAVITPTAPIEGANAGQSIDVRVSVADMNGVLTVPTEALVSRIDGSYALQVVADDGTDSFVAVEVLGVAGATAAVRGEGVTAGMSVLQPL